MLAQLRREKSAGRSLAESGGARTRLNARSCFFARTGGAPWRRDLWDGARTKASRRPIVRVLEIRDVERQTAEFGIGPQFRCQSGRTRAAHPIVLHRFRRFRESQGDQHPTPSDRWPDYGNGSYQNNGSNDPQFPGFIDARQRILCDNLKNAKDSKGRSMYTIYTIQVNTSSPADPTSSILQYCASSPDKFYELTASSQIVTTFNSIGTALSKLRVAN